MVKRLTSYLRRTTGWRFLGKTVLLSAALGVLAWAGFSFWPALVFIAAALAAYFSESPERKVLRSSFWLASGLGFLGAVTAARVSNPALGGSVPVLLILVFGAVVFGWFGLVNSFFGNRHLAHGLLNSGMAVFLFVLAFYLAPAPGEENILPLLVWFLVVFWGLLLLIRESVAFEVPVPVRSFKLTVWSFALIGAEVASVTLFLPLGFLNAAALLSLFYILGRDALSAGFKGFLSPSLILRELAIFAVVLSLIFATVTWVLP